MGCRYIGVSREETIAPRMRPGLQRRKSTAPLQVGRLASRGVYCEETCDNRLCVVRLAADVQTSGRRDAPRLDVPGARVTGEPSMLQPLTMNACAETSDEFEPHIR
jgi:hypothetical protein